MYAAVEHKPQDKINKNTGIQVGEVHSHDHNLRSVSSSVPGGGLKVEKSGYDTCALNTVCKMRCYTKNPVSVGEVHSHNHNLRSVSSSVPGEGVIRRILEEGLIVDHARRSTLRKIIQLYSYH